MQNELDQKIAELLRQKPLSRAIDEAVLEAPANLRRVIEQIRDRHQLDLRRAKARAGFSRGHLLDVVLFSSEFSSQTDGAGRSAAEELVRGVLGDRLAERWIGQIDIAPAPREGGLRVLNTDGDAGAAFPIHELGAAIGAAIRGLQDGLPEHPCWNEHEATNWTLFELEPEERDDYPAQDDLVMATTMRPELLKCFLQSMPFSSERFSRHGELFCYLKYRSRATSGRARLSERARIEDALTATLGEKRLGAAVGNGFGLRYSYLILALSEAREALDCIASSAQELGLPERSWILFCDDELADGWLALGKKRTPPPGST